MCYKTEKKIAYRSIQNYYPRKFVFFFSELIRRGVIYYAGNFLPQIISVELTCGVILYHIMWIDCFGGKKLLQKI